MKKKLLKTGFYFLFVILADGCAHRDHPAGPPYSSQGGAMHVQDISLSSELEDKVLSLDPNAITEKEITEVLSRCPAPRIINLDGSIPVITMESFSRFLISMGYPEERVRNPANGRYSYSSYMGSARLAGLIAWHYEKEGMMPMVIGHSQGGMLSIKVLHELAGAFRENIPVWDPHSAEPEVRHTIRDPLSGAERPVVGLKVGYASAIATGKFMRFLLGQWDMLTKLRKIPDTVEEFTGFHIKYDLLGGSFFGPGESNRYQPIGSAVVRNVWLPAHYSHITIPLTEELAKDAEAREWINSYRPLTENPELTVVLRGRSDNILFAADIWHSIKKRWCIELQRLIRARRSEQNLLKICLPG